MANFNEVVNRCLLCNESIDESDIHIINVSLINDISKRWSDLPREVCNTAPYNEFINARSRFPGKITFSIFFICSFLN